MFGLDDAAGRARATARRSLVVLAVALLLGLRHATDPDHLAAVSTLIASDPEDGTRRAGRLGLAWGVGPRRSRSPCSACRSCCSGPTCPSRCSAAAEARVGLMIMFLAVRLLLRWRRGSSTRTRIATARSSTAHLHPHEQATRHDHAHEPEGRWAARPSQAFGIGLVHGMGGSAGVGVLLLATIPDRAEAVAALVVLALGHRAVHGDPVLRLRLRDHPRARAQADARLRARDGRR